MKTKTSIITALLMALLLAFLCTTVVASEEDPLEQPSDGVSLTVIGTVNNDFQVVTDSGEKYDIGVGDTGDSLLQNVGKKVQVIGILIEEAGEKILDVLSFSVLNE